MDFDSIVQQAIDYGQSNPLVVLGIVAVLVLLTIRNTKAMMKFYGFCILVLVVFYVLSLISGTIDGGIEQKDKMIYKTPEAIDD